MRTHANTPARPVRPESDSAPSTSITIGSRDDGYHRYFGGEVYEVMVFNTSLSQAALESVTTQLQTAYNITRANCSPRPAPHLDCATLRSSLCSPSNWPRKCGLNATETDRLHAFLHATTSMPDNLPVAMARTALDYARGFDQRCAGLNNGTVPPLSSDKAVLASLTDLLSASGNWYSGLDNAMRNRYNGSDAEPLARELAAVWGKLFVD